MKRLYSTFLSAIALLSIAGCSTSNDPSFIEERRSVSAIISQELYVVVKQPINDTDEVFDPSIGIIFPIGRYVLEAEDAQYWYFRAPKPLKMAVYEFGKTVNGVSIYGGLAISKAGDNTEPKPLTYVDDKTRTSKVIVWKNSPVFPTLRGTKWVLSTDRTTTPDADSSTSVDKK